MSLIRSQGFQKEIREDDLEAHLLTDLYGINENDTNPHGVADILKIKQMGKKFVRNARN